MPLAEPAHFKRLIFDASTKQYVPAPKFQLVVYRDSQGSNQLQVMELVPSSDYVADHPGYTLDNDYSGTQKFYTWSGQFIRGFRYEKGVITGKLTPVKLPSQSISTKGARRQIECNYWNEELLFIGCINYNGEGTAVGTTVYYPEDAFTPYPPTPDQTDPLSYISCDGAWQSNGTTTYQVCSASSYYDPFNPSGPSNPSDIFNPAPGSGPTVQLELQNNKIGLFGPCPGLTDSWRSQLTFKAPTSVSDKLSRLAHMPAFTPPNPYGLANNWYVQSIKTATGVAVNLDNFSVFMSDLPIVNGNRLTVDEFVDYFRIRINQFVDTNKGNFTPHPGTDENEVGIWQSGNAVGAVISIDIPLLNTSTIGDDGSVIVSQQVHGSTASSWTFSTIHDPWNGDHPVSGTREFGCYQTSGGYIFYTQGADRLTNWWQGFAGDVNHGADGSAFQFGEADALWVSMQGKLATFLSDPNSGVGTVQIRTPVTNRPNWSAVKSALDNNRSLSTVPCN